MKIDSREIAQSTMRWFIVGDKCSSSSDAERSENDYMSECAVGY